MLIHALPEAKSTAISAVVIRADGRRVNLGLISFKHRNPIIHWAVNLYISVKDYFNDHSRSK